MTATRPAPSAPAGSLGGWLTDLRTAALVGTSRREAPEPPAVLGVVRSSADTPREARLLDGAALADVLVRAGTRPLGAAASMEPAPAESRPVVGAGAAQLLTLLLTQPPMSRSARDELLVEWLRAADAAGRRVPHAQLPVLLAHAATRSGVAAALGDTLGERGRWLARLRADWAPLAGVPGSAAGPAEGAVDEDWVATWQTLPATEAAAAFGRARSVDPAGARGALETEWDSLPARVRSECTRLLTVGVSSADEPLLERALDDRSKSVRESAWRVLDQLPASARGQRMAQRLRSLLHVRGTLRRTLEVEVPDDPDQAGVRDGLVTAPAGTAQPRTEWLAAIIRGAPLSTWTDVTGRSPAATLQMVRQDAQAVAAITSTVLRRGDGEWAAALVAQGVADPRLVPLLPTPDRVARVLAGLRTTPVPHDVREALQTEQRPWDPALARTVLDVVTREDGEHLVAALSAVLPTAIPVALAPEVSTALSRLGPDSAARRVLAETLQIHAFRSSLTEALR